MGESKMVEYQCDYCGLKTSCFVSNGKPANGCCNARPKKNNVLQPHKWIKVRTFTKQWWC